MRGMTFSWLIATACALLCVLCGFAIGSLFELGETAWRVSAQPIATVLAGLGALAAGLLACFNGVRLRELQSEQHRSDSVRDREARLHERYSTAAAQLADASPAIREAGEEAGIAPGDVSVVAALVTHRTIGGWTYTTVIADAQRPVITTANGESAELRWVPEAHVATLPLHPAFGSAWPQLRERLASLDSTT